MSAARSVLELLKDFRWLAEHSLVVTVTPQSNGTSYHVRATWIEGLRVMVEASDRYLQNALHDVRAKAEHELAARGVVPAAPSVADHFDAVEQTAEDARDPAAREMLERIEGYLGDEHYAWAEETLAKIQETVARTGKVTPRQRESVDNIEAAVLRREDR